MQKLPTLPTEKDILSRIKEIHIVPVNANITESPFTTLPCLDYITNIKFSDFINVSSVELKFNWCSLWSHSVRENTSFVAIDNYTQIPCKTALTKDNKILCDLWVDLDALMWYGCPLTELNIITHPMNRSLPFSMSLSYDKLRLDKRDFSTNNIIVVNGRYPHIVRKNQQLGIFKYQLPCDQKWDDTKPIYHTDMSKFIYHKENYNTLDWFFVYYLLYPLQKKYRRKMLRRKLEKFIEYYYSTKHAGTNSKRLSV